MKFKGIELPNGTYKVEFNNGNISVFDDKDNCTYFEASDGYWLKRKFDDKSNETYYENSNGVIFDRRPKELTVKETSDLLGFTVKIKGE